MIPEDSARFRIVQADGADFVRDSPHDIDVLMVDGFDHKGQPAQLCSRIFYETCKSALSSQGVLVVNLAPSFSPQKLLARIEDAFGGNVAAVASTFDANTIAFASRGVVINPVEFRRKFRPLYSRLKTGSALNG